MDSRAHVEVLPSAYAVSMRQSCAAQSESDYTTNATTNITPEREMMISGQGVTVGHVTASYAPLRTECYNIHPDRRSRMASTSSADKATHICAITDFAVTSVRVVSLEMNSKFSNTQFSRSIAPPQGCKASMRRNGDSGFVLTWEGRARRL